MRLGLSLIAIAALLACSSSSNHASSDAGIDAQSDTGPDSASSSSGGSGSSSGSGGSGSSSGLPITDGSGQPPCTITLQGAVNLSFSCTTTTEYFTASNRSFFAIMVADSRPLQLLSISLQNAGRPMSSTWSSSDPGASGGVEVQEAPVDGGPAPTWQVTAGETTPPDASATDASSPEAGPQDGGTTEGSYTLVLEVGIGMPTPTGESFGSTGTFTATLPAVMQSGAMGTVTVHVDF
jgi:hypothetical protein